LKKNLLVLEKLGQVAAYCRFGTRLMKLASIIQTHDIKP